MTRKGGWSLGWAVMGALLAVSATACGGGGEDVGQSGQAVKDVSPNTEDSSCCPPGWNYEQAREGYEDGYCWKDLPESSEGLGNQGDGTVGIRAHCREAGEARDASERDEAESDEAEEESEGAEEADETTSS